MSSPSGATFLFECGAGSARAPVLACTTAFVQLRVSVCPQPCTCANKLGELPAVEPGY